MDRLRHFLGKAPDGREIYRYRLPDERYHELRRYLRESLRSGLGSTSRENQALFCVFSAEWWRREHECGPWSWEGIRGALGLGGEPYTAIARAAESGLDLLKRPVLRSERGDRRWLVTLACEGGLPLRRLDVEGARLRAYFRDVLEHLEALGMTGGEDVATLEQIAARYEHRLSSSLREPIVHRLVGELVGRAWSLRRLLTDPDRPPIPSLDDDEPRWRDRLPLVVSDKSAEALLRGLMNDVARVASGGGRRLSLITQIVLSKERARLIRSLDVSANLSGDHLRAAFGGRPLPEGSRIQLRLRTEDGDTAQAGLLCRSGEDRWSYQGNAQLSGVPAGGQVSLIAATRRGGTLETMLPGSNPLGPLPWVFRSTEHTARWELVATGSARRREPELIVALPTGSEPTGDWADLGVSLLERRLIKVDGELLLDTASGRVRIVADHDDNASAIFALRGQRFDTVTTSRTAWRGMPSLVRHAGWQKETLSFEVRGTGGWRPAGPGDTGSLTVRSRIDGEVVFQEDIRVVPPDLEIRLTVGDRRRAGSVSVSSSALVQAGAPEDPRWQTSVETIGGETRISIVEMGAESPAYLPITLVFERGMLQGRVPFPVRSMRFEDAAGEPLRSGTQVHVKRLGGIRAVGLSPRIRAQFAITLSLEGVGGAPRPAEQTFPLSTAGTGEQALDLRNVQSAVLELLNTTDQLDARARLALWEIGGTSSTIYIEARRYDWTLQHDVETGDIALLGLDEADDLDEVVVEARPFSAVDQVEHLPRLHTARFSEPRWVFEARRFDACSWLIAARQGSWYRCRPIPVQGGGAPRKATGLAAALENPRARGRRSEIQAHLEALCASCNHPDWCVVDSHLSLLGGLPTAAFDLLHVVANTPTAAALVALRSAKSTTTDLIRVLEGFEELLFLWEAVPFQVWLRALELLHASFPTDLSEFADQEVIARGQRLGEQLPVVLAALHHWTRGRGLPDPEAPADLPVQMTFSADNDAPLLSLRDDLVVSLIQHHRDRTSWPAPPPGLDAGDVSLARDHHAPHQRAVIDAPAVVARAAAGEITPSADLTLFLEVCRNLDESYFRNCFLMTSYALIARHHGAR